MSMTGLREDRRERPLIMSAPMVRAVLAGRKTMTRRVLAAGTATVNGSTFNAKSPAWTGLRLAEATARTKSPWTGLPDPHLDVPWEHPEDATAGVNSETVYRVRPLIEVGQRLWVREAFARVGDNEDDIHACPDLRVHAYYRADATCPEQLRWRSPIFMPRALSRLTLIVESVRVERLADISDADARSEGFEAFGPDIADPYQDGPCGDAADAFAAYWDSLHGKGAFEVSPWVAAIGFRAIHANIDAADTPATEEGAR